MYLTQLKKAQPAFFINGIEVKCDADGVAVYKFKSPMKAGKYSVPVKIIYTKPNGIKDTVFKTLSYTVAE